MYVVGFRDYQREGWAYDLSRETREEIDHPRINSLSLSSQLLSRKGYFVHESAREFLIMVKEKQIQEKQRTGLQSPLGFLKVYRWGLLVGTPLVIRVTLRNIRSSRGKLKRKSNESHPSAT